MSGQKILDGLRDAVAGNFSRVTINGQTWVRRDADNERLRAALEAVDSEIVLEGQLKELVDEALGSTGD